jgi:hypothetical protein
MAPTPITEARRLRPVGTNKWLRLIKQLLNAFQRKPPAFR